MRMYVLARVHTLSLSVYPHEDDLKVHRDDLLDLMKTHDLSLSLLRNFAVPVSSFPSLPLRCTLYGHIYPNMWWANKLPQHDQYSKGGVILMWSLNGTLTLSGEFRNNYADVCARADAPHPPSLVRRA